MPEPPAGSGRDLPAAYRSPWLALRDDLLAVAASLGLAWRRLWRRNRQGELPLPAFWPQSLAALFWPLLLALPLALAALLWLRPARLPAPGLRPVDDAGPASAVAASTPAGRATAAAPAAAGPASDVAAGPPPTPDSPVVSAPAAASVQEAAPGADSAVAPAAPAAEPAAPDTEPAAATAAARPVDPLLQAFAAADPDRWIRAATALPERQQLSLRLAARFMGLSVAERRQLAESWYHQAVALGYEHLVLRDGLDRLLGRDALVGSGMILLDDGFPS